MKLMWQRPVILLISSYPSIDEVGALYSEECNMLLDTVRKAAAKRHHIRLVHLHNPKNLQEIEKKIQKYRKRLLFVHYVGHSQQEIVLDAYGVERPELYFDFGAYQPLRQKLQHIQENALLSKYIPLQGVFLHSCASDITGHSRANFPEIVTNRKVFDAQVAKHAQKFYRTLLWDGLPVDKAFAHSLAKEAAVVEGMGMGVARAFRAVPTAKSVSAYRIQLPEPWQPYSLPKSIWLAPIVYIFIILGIAALCSMVVLQSLQQSVEIPRHDDADVYIAAALYASDCNVNNQMILRYITNGLVFNFNAYVNPIKHINKLSHSCTVQSLEPAVLNSYARQKKVDLLILLHIDEEECKINAAQGYVDFRIYLYVAHYFLATEFFGIGGEIQKAALNNFPIRLPCQERNRAHLPRAFQDKLQNSAVLALNSLIEVIYYIHNFEMGLKTNSSEEESHQAIIPILETLRKYQSDLKIHNVETDLMHNYFIYYFTGILNLYLRSGYTNTTLYCLDNVQRSISQCADTLLASVEGEDNTLARVDLGRSYQEITLAMLHPHTSAEACHSFHQGMQRLVNLIYSDDTTISVDIRNMAKYALVEQYQWAKGAMRSKMPVVSAQCLLHPPTDMVTSSSDYYYSREEGQCVLTNVEDGAIWLLKQEEERYGHFLCWLERIREDYEAENIYFPPLYSANIYMRLASLYLELEPFNERYAYHKAMQHYQKAYNLLTSITTANQVWVNVAKLKRNDVIFAMIQESFQRHCIAGLNDGLLPMLDEIAYQEMEIVQQYVSEISRHLAVHPNICQKK